MTGVTIIMAGGRTHTSSKTLREFTEDYEKAVKYGTLIVLYRGVFINPYQIIEVRGED